MYIDMASTRNRNTPGDYKMEQQRNIDRVEYLTNKQNSYGAPVNTYFAGDGLITGRIAAENLSNNYCDIESKLFGIGATNLVYGSPKVFPDVKPIQSLSIIDRLKIVLPEPLAVEKDQRPSPLN
jgi:hypothetical protein